MSKNSGCETDSFPMSTHLCLRIPVMTPDVDNPGYFPPILGLFLAVFDYLRLHPADASSHRHSLLVSAWHVLHTNVTTHKTKVPRYNTARIVKPTNLFPRIPVIIMTAWKCPPIQSIWKCPQTQTVSWCWHTSVQNPCHDADRITMSTHFCPRILPSGSTTAYFLGLLHSTWKRRNHQLTNLVRTGITIPQRSSIKRHWFKLYY